MVQSVIRERSFNSVQVFWIDTDLVWERLERCVATLIRNPHVMKVALFGPFAEGHVSGISEQICPFVMDKSFQ